MCSCRTNDRSPPPCAEARPLLWRCSRLAAAAAALLLGGCVCTPVSIALQRGLAVDLRLGSGLLPAGPGRELPVLRADTATPLSLWMFAADAGTTTPHAGLAIELEVLDLRGATAQHAVVQPVRLRTDTQGYAAPVTFLAAQAGEFVVRATYRDAERVVSAYSMRIVVGEAAKQ
ncbi:MAG: hypothetical protein JNN30_03545 [Rhodanobacteraceae bacterium]|nr:hypothetical protein [Rhodanobacteraceae bacterium]